MIKRQVEISLEYQETIPAPPVSQAQLWQAATSNDDITILSWRDQWIRQIKENKEHFGSFKDNGIGKLWNKYKHQPAICIGSGPSLKWNVDDLKERGSVMSISCLHNFQFLEDRGVPADYYVTLDAGEVTLEEVYEGGQHDEEHYWELTKDRTLLAFIGAYPPLLKKWRGKIIFFNAPIPNDEVTDEIDKVETFVSYVSTGGNVLGACVYIARAIFGCNPVAFVGADFAFGYDEKFHGWDSKYDNKLGRAIRVTDVFGNKVSTWSSYNNFKSFFDNMVCRVPGIWVNCTEGGTLGAYKEGNIAQIKQSSLKDFLLQWTIHEQLSPQFLEPDKREGKLPLLY